MGPEEEKCRKKNKRTTGKGKETKRREIEKTQRVIGTITLIRQ